jgi:mannosyltransferase
MAGLAASDAVSRTKLTLLGPLLIVFLLGMALRLYDLDADSLRLDEVKTVNTSQLDLPSMLSFQAEASVHPPLLYLVTHLFMNLCGHSDFVVRLHAALLGSISVLLTYKLGQILWSNETGVIGAFLLAISAYDLQYSQEARHYSLMVFFSLLSLIFLLYALEGGQRRMWILFALCATLLIYTHYFALLVLAAELLFAVWVIVESRLSSPRKPSRTRKQALCLLGALGLIAICYLPWLPSLQQQLLGRYIQFEGFGEGTVPKVELSVSFFADALRAYTQVDGVPLLLFLALLLLGLARSRLRHNVLFGLWIVTPLVVPLIVKASHFFSYRYAIFVVPILLLGVARGVSVSIDLLTRRLPPLRDHPQARTALLSLSITSIFGVLAVTPVTNHYLYERADLRGVARYLEQTLQPGDVVLTDDVGYGVDRRVRMALSHYLSAEGAEEAPILDVRLGICDDLSTVEQDQGRVWAVLWYPGRSGSGQGTPHGNIVDFPGLLIISPTGPSCGDRLQDAASTLEVLLDVMPTDEGRFEVHLALAEIYLTSSRFDDARSQLEQAEVVRRDDPQARADMRKAKVQLFRQAYAAWETGYSPWFSFGQVVALLHHNVRISAEGASRVVNVTLWWGALAEMDRDYTTFVHLIDHEGHVVAQADRLLRQGGRPTSEWLAGSVARKRYHLELGPDTTPGDYVVRVGLYYWKSGKRLAVCDENGNRVPDDAITLEATDEAP